jgi:nitrogen regulatory protein P-II 1
MFKVEALVRQFKLDDIKAALENIGITEYLICEVFCHENSAHAPKSFYRGAAYQLDVPRVKLELVVSSLRVDEVVETLTRVSRTDAAGDDGTILTFELAEGVRIHTGGPLLCAVT